MIDVTRWIDQYMDALKAAFGGRVMFAGLQGSHARGEAGDDSDIDMVVILDELTPRDIKAYDAMLGRLSDRERACGFLSGVSEIMNWEPSDLFQFCHDTRPIIGSLEPVLALVDADDVARAVRIGACSVYHGCVHNMLYKKDESVLRRLCKSASFVVRARVWLRKGLYAGPLAELAELADEKDRRIVSACIALGKGEALPFDSLSETLFRWAGEIITARETDPD